MTLSHCLSALFAEGAHGEVYLGIVIVPIKVDFNVFLCCIIHGDVIILFDSVHQVASLPVKSCQ